MYICAILLFLLGFRIEGSHETTVGYGDTLFLDDHQPYEITADFVLKGSVVTEVFRDPEKCINYSITRNENIFEPP